MALVNDKQFQMNCFASYAAWFQSPAAPLEVTATRFSSEGHQIPILTILEQYMAAFDDLINDTTLEMEAEDQTLATWTLRKASRALISLYPIIQPPSI